MPTVVGVKLRFVAKTLWFDPAGLEPDVGDSVIVETERGTEIGQVSEAPHVVDPSSLPAPLKPVVRVATVDDLEQEESNAAQERDALRVFRELVKKHALDMKPVDVEYQFGGDKIIFYFSSEERVDFRDLVRELASRFKARIEMRQVGVRDEARHVGGVGHCGQQLCCARLSGEFQPVSIRMAKEQDLPLNPLKISGLCGRLMCCLRYEYDAYKDFKSRAPKRGAQIDTPLGVAKVVDLNTPREMVSIRLEDGSSFTVPLASMSCSQGTGCPCAVEREVLERTGTIGVQHLAMERENERSTTPVTTVPARKPRRRNRGTAEGQAQEAQEAQPGVQAPAPTARRGAAAAAPVVQESGGAGLEDSRKAATGRRRRRRRPGPKPESTGE